MNMQEHFDIIVNHLITQNKRSVIQIQAPSGSYFRISDDVCAYRGENGLKCAIGCLIPDEKYSKSLEGLSVSAGSVKEILFPSDQKMDDDAIDMLLSCQEVHDEIPVSSWHLSLQKVANLYGLDFNPPSI